MPQLNELVHHITPVSPDPEIEAYVVDLRSYNQGPMEGFWMDCTSDADQMRDEVHAFMKKQREKHGDSRDEYAVFDWMGDCAPSTEHPDWNEVAQLVGTLEDYKDSDPNIVAAALTADIPIDKIDESYMGQFQFVEDFFFEQLRDLDLDLPQDHPLKNYIDWRSYARDQLLNGEYEAVQVSYDTIYIFKTRL